MSANPTCAVVTVVTRSHLHRARWLFDSVHRHLPEADRFAVLASGRLNIPGLAMRRRGEQTACARRSIP